MECPDCGKNNNTIKHGIRETDKGTVQKYFCKNCDTHFSSSKRQYTQYPEHVILFALEMYNLGHPVKEVKSLTGQKYKYSPPTRTIYSWIKRYRETLTFLRLRKKFEVHPENVITTQRFEHLQVYPFKYHALKMHLAAKEFPQLRRYISWVERSLPDEMFLKGPRASSTEINNGKVLKPKQKDTIASKLSDLALTTRSNDESKHDVQDFVLSSSLST